MNAAEIRIKSETPLKAANRGQGTCQILLSGEIKKGDAAEFAEIYSKLKPALDSRDYWGQGGDGFDLCLDSPGGLLSEGILIAKFLRKEGIATYLPRNAQCVSACAVVFFGGSLFMDVRSNMRLMHAGAKLGLHAPSLTLNADIASFPPEIMKSIIDSSYKSAVADVREISETLVAPTNGEASLSSMLLIKMLSTPPDKVFWIETINDVGLYDIPILSSLASTPLSKKTLSRGCFNLLSWAESVPSRDHEESGFVEGVSLNISRVNDPRARDVEEAWKFQESGTWGGGVEDSYCTFFITKGEKQISAEKLRAVVYNSRIDDTTFYEQVPSWMLMHPDTSIKDLAGR